MFRLPETLDSSHMNGWLTYRIARDAADAEGDLNSYKYSHVAIDLS